MLKTLVFSLIIALGLIHSSATSSFAQTKLARPSASFAVEYESKRDRRSEILAAFLNQYNSPFADQAHIFVRQADKYDLDWRFVAAISGVESTFGNRYPQGSYNAWGWGIYGTNRHGFASWEDAISTISRELRERYMNKWGATDVYAIGDYYAASPTWASKVTFFMDRMTAFEASYTSDQLPISL